MNEFITCLKKYATFQGRARRKEYWFFILFSMLLGIGAAIVDAFLVDGTRHIFYGIIRLGIFIPSIAVTIRRMHDVDKSGWFCLIPIYNLILCCTEGTRGGNRFGPDPKAQVSQID
jgi:uncharacterized membrane protein YhaH (DUF805 family)